MALIEGQMPPVTGLSKAVDEPQTKKLTPFTIQQACLCASVSQPSRPPPPLRCYADWIHTSNLEPR